MENILGECPQQLHSGRNENRPSDGHYLVGTQGRSAPAIRRNTISRRCKLANRSWQDSVVGLGDAADEFRYIAGRQSEPVPECDELSGAGQTIYRSHLLGRIFSWGANIAVELRAENSGDMGLFANFAPGPACPVYL